MLLLLVGALVATRQIGSLSLVPGDREFLMVTAWLFAAAAQCAVWVPAMCRLDSRYLVRASDLPPRVLCPACGYDLHGLSTLICPECGRRYAIQELLAAQPPGAARARANLMP